MYFYQKLLPKEMFNKLSSYYIAVALFTSILSFSQRRDSPAPQNPSAASMRSGAFIDVNAANYPQSAYTIDQLIKNVLITGGNSACSTSNVSNVTVFPATAASSAQRSWGYFNRATTAFPFKDGIVLSTGFAKNAGNSFYNGTLSDDLGTGSDPDLVNAMGFSPFVDATYIEFDFVPNTTVVKFNYIFASEEYTGSFPCQYDDGFALLLKKQGDPTYTNMAVLPNNAGPVKVTNVHPPVNGFCGAVNQQYFAGYNTSAVETNFNGRVIPLTAIAPVIPGQTYHFKMVLGDAKNLYYDSAVFIDGGSFNIGVQITDPAGTALPATVPVCNGTSQTLVANTTVPGSTFQWSLNGTPISGATSSTYTATQPGTYVATVTIPGSNCPATAQVIITELPGPVVQNSSITRCSDTSTAVFDLTSAQSSISTTAGATYTYYQNLADANAGNTNTIATPNSFTSGSGNVYVLVKSGGCSKVATLSLTVAPNPAMPVITASSSTICYGGTVTLTSNYATGNTWSTGEPTQSITINSAGTYTVTNTNGSCTSAPATAVISAETNPNLQISGNLNYCQGTSTTLTASATGTYTYLWNNGQTGATLNVTTPGTYTVTATSATGCTYQKSATVTEQPQIVAQNATLTNCSTTPTAIFNLTSAQPSLSSTPGVTFQYYTNSADANAQNGNFIQNPTAYTSGNATLYVLIKNGACSKVVTLTLTVSANPSPVITASSPKICGNSTVTLTSSSATGNVWSTGQTTQSITISTTGTYSLTVNNGNCTSASTSVTITGDPDPNIQISGNTLLCAPSTTLTATTASTGNTFSWSNGQTGATMTTSTAGTYAVTVTTPSGCQFTKSVTVTQGNVPAVNNFTASVCSPTSTYTFDLTSYQNSISTGSGLTFSYYTSLANAQNQTAPITNPTSYSTGTTTVFVLVKNATCSAIAQLQLNVNQTPTPAITASAPSICGTTPVVLTSNYATGNVWSTGQTTQSITVSTPGSYTLNVTQNGCTGTQASVNVTQTPDPNIQISGNLIFCEGNSTTLTATSTGTGNTYSWSNGSTGNTAVITTGGLQTVTVTTPSGCTFTKTVTVTMDPKILISIATPQELNCSNSQITINASNSTVGTGATILWTTNGGHIVSGANTLSPIVDQPGTYTLTVTSAAANGCTAQQSVVIIKNITPPTIGLTAPKTTICSGDSVVLQASGGQTYTWTGLSGNGSTQTVSPTATTTYTVTGIGTNGCTATTPATITITVVPGITSTLADGQMCEGNDLILDAGTGTNYTYLWSNGATTQTISVNTPGTYTVTISNGSCSKTFSANVSYIQTPVISSVNYDHLTHSLTINAVNENLSPLEYSIDGGVTWQMSNIFYNIKDNTNYPISVRNSGVLCGTTISYYTFFMQNVITPNGDGVNDFIDFSSMVKFENFGGGIFDRYGEKVFTPSLSTPIWKGVFLNQPLPTATYWYNLKWLDPASHQEVINSGWILLKNRE